jgi:hypothetical protein
LIISCFFLHFVSVRDPSVVDHHFRNAAMPDIQHMNPATGLLGKVEQQIAIPGLHAAVVLFSASSATKRLGNGLFGDRICLHPGFLCRRKHFETFQRTVKLPIEP